MKKTFKRLFTFVIALMMLCSLMIPVNAAEARGTKYCPDCWDVLMPTETYVRLVKRDIPCEVLPREHEHLYWYDCEDWVCFGCGYMATLTTFKKEECRIGNYSLRPQ